VDDIPCARDKKKVWEHCPSDSEKEIKVSIIAGVVDI
jgi:hypothetical protein